MFCRIGHRHHARPPHAYLSQHVAYANKHDNNQVANKLYIYTSDGGFDILK